MGMGSERKGRLKFSATEIKLRLGELELEKQKEDPLSAYLLPSMYIYFS